MPFTLRKDSLWDKVPELQSHPSAATPKCVFTVQEVHENVKQRGLFVEAALKKCPILPMSLQYHGYSKTFVIV